MLVGDSVVERASDGALTVVADLATLYEIPNDEIPNGHYHSNAIHYYAWDDSYTIADRVGRLFVKIARNGTLAWQLGGSSPVAPYAATGGAPEIARRNARVTCSDG